MAKEGLCPTCAHAIVCPTWTEYKCAVKEKRICDYKTWTECESYQKRPKDWVEPKCHCKSCLENEKLFEEETENI